MKHIKILALVLVLLVISVIGITAYIGKHEQEGHEPNATIGQLKDKRVLVLFFSRAGDNYKVGKVKKGNTAFLAEYIAEITGADLFEITAKKNYDISYTEMLRIVREEWENEEYPEYAKSLQDISQYDIVFVGGPIWWGTYPRVVFSFFKEHNLNRKVLIPFTTNEGSGLGNTKADLQRFFPDAIILDGFSMSGQEARKPEARNNVKQWLETVNFKAAETAPKKDIDGLTSATPMHKELTSQGQAHERQTTRKLDIKFQDGHIERKELVIKGFVDMGGRTLWSATNLGANFPWEIGNHYAWGETESKQSYEENNYLYYHQAIGNDISRTWYDAVRKELGGNGRMPTKEEWHELLFNTKHDWVSIHDCQGYLFTAKNGSLLFFPANGYKYGDEIGTPDEGYYWTSTYSNIDNAYVAYLPSNSWGISNYGRYIGLGIRPVK